MKFSRRAQMKEPPSLIGGRVSGDCRRHFRFLHDLQLHPQRQRQLRETLNLRCITTENNCASPLELTDYT